MQLNRKRKLKGYSQQNGEEKEIVNKRKKHNIYEIKSVFRKMFLLYLSY